MKNELFRIHMKRIILCFVYFPMRPCNHVSVVFNFSAEGGHADLLEYLIRCGLQIQPDNQSRTVLMHAARAGHVTVLKLITKHAPEWEIDINARDCNGENVLFYAIRGRSMEIITTLLEHGANVCNNKYGVNILSQSMSEGNDSVVQAILSSDITLSEVANGKDTKGRTIFHHCVLKGDKDLLQKVSMYYCADVDTDIEGATVLMRACQQATFSLVKYLIDNVAVDVHR